MLAATTREAERSARRSRRPRAAGRLQLTGNRQPTRQQMWLSADEDHEHRSRHPDAHAYEFGRSAAPPTMGSVLRTGEPVDASAHPAHRERYVEVRLVVRLQLERREEAHCLA